MLYLAHIYVRRKAAQHALLLCRNALSNVDTCLVRSMHDDSPRKEKLRALPFLTTLAQATSSYEIFHRGNWFLSQLTPPVEHVKEVLLPWWVVGATVDVTVTSAQVGMWW